MKYIYIFLILIFSPHIFSQEIYISTSDAYTDTKIYKLEVETCELEHVCTFVDKVGSLVFHPDGTPYFIANRHKSWLVIPHDTADIYLVDFTNCSLINTGIFFPNNSGYINVRMNEKGELIYHLNNDKRVINVKNGESKFVSTRAQNELAFIDAGQTYNVHYESSGDYALYKYENIDSSTFLLIIGHFYNLQSYGWTSINDYQDFCGHGDHYGGYKDRTSNNFLLYQYDISNNTLNLVCDSIINTVLKSGTISSPTAFLSTDPNCDLLIDLDGDNSSGQFPYDYQSPQQCDKYVWPICDEDVYIHTSEYENNDTVTLDSIVLTLSNIKNPQNESLVNPSPSSNILFYAINDSTFVLKALSDKSDSIYEEAIKNLRYENTSTSPIEGERTISLVGYSVLRQGEIVNTYIPMGASPQSGIDTTFTFCDDLLVENISNIIGGQSMGYWQPSLSIHDTFDDQYDAVGQYNYITNSMYCGADTSTIHFIKSSPLTATADTITCDNKAIMLEGNTYETGDTIKIQKPNIIGCDSIIYMIYNQRTIPQIEISSSNDTICEGELSSLFISGGQEVKWDDGDTSNSKAVSAGKYSAVVTDRDGCKVTLEKEINNYPKADYEITTTPASCDENNGSIIIQPNDFKTLVLNDQEAPSDALESLNEDYYDLELIDQNNCKYLFTDLKVEALVSPAFNIESTYLLNHNEEINIQIGNNFNIKYIEASIDSSSCRFRNGILWIKGTTNQTITLVVEDVLGCTNEFIIQVNVNPIKDFKISNVFCPTSLNPQNTNWVVEMPFNYRIISCNVFDRWGNVVYNSSNYISWDGTANGIQCQTGVYIYYIEYLDSTFNKHILKGDITLLR